MSMEEEIDRILENVRDSSHEYDNQLLSAEEQAQQYKELLQKSQADLQNYKRRASREQDENAQRAKAHLIGDMLLVVDDLDRAVDSKANSQQDKIWTEGIGLIRDKLMLILEKEGLTKIEAQGHAFDPNIHEAIAGQTTDDTPEGTVTTVHQDGYKLNNYLIRPSKVTVSQKPNQDSLNVETSN